MKKFLNFLVWLWRRTDWFDRAMLVSGFTMGYSIGLDSPYSRYVFLAGVSVPAFIILRWIFYVVPRNAWRQYNEEQDKVVDLLKKDYSSDRRY